MVSDITVEYDVSRINSYFLSKKYCMKLLLNMTLKNLLKIITKKKLTKSNSTFVLKYCILDLDALSENQGNRRIN